ncbi:transcription-repair coupling factor [Aliiglaciecola sp. CAU 1673]|uniref:transcription-repair coupling factor n=1 Tax=Aliiglaciecola sp. CAU 1673 TaxID=3032595 RepID=UPI0023DCE05E|nr:transcription-repair coupling factor [Aliiglaciecola sp. CAU 1673]MDF2178840.1 transcription-repair coupling factor [Aliiglaciecola sp. CAU 1673]
MSTSIFSPPLPKKPGDNLQWGNLHGSSLALLLANTLKQQQGSVLLITADTPSALKLAREIDSFLLNESGASDKPSGKPLVKVFPDWETLPYDTFSPHQDIISQRLETLFHLTQPQPCLYVVPVNTLLQRIAPVDYLGRYLLILKQGQKLELDSFRQGLERAGYQAVNQVISHGEYSIRGGIMDLYPMGSKQPYRIDLFDDEIDSIRLFDPDTQRSGDKVAEIKLLPAHEFPTDKAAIDLFRRQFLERFDASNAKDSFYYQVGKGIMPAGIEYYLPLFFEKTATLLDYLHPDSLVLMHGDLVNAAEFYWADLNERYEQYRYNPLRPLLAPAEIYLKVDELFGALKHRARVQVQHGAVEDKAGRSNFPTAAIRDIAIKPQNKVPMASLNQAIREWREEGAKVLFSVESQGRRESLLGMLKKIDCKPKAFEHLDAFLASHESLGVIIGDAEHSFELNEPDAKLALVTETELLGHKISQRRLRDKRQATDEAAVIRNLAELTQGQPVVHLEHGVGRYQGLQTLDAGGLVTEYLTIEYANAAKLYVPVSSLHLISRYSGGDLDHAPLHHLGTDAWSKARKKAAEKVRDVAAQLLDIYARRAAKPGFAIDIDWQEYQRFADSFPFEETADQEQAINAVIRDMGSPMAMDRLVCGDVGFGKTEVAMRAAFLAANAGKQVAILVPTTLLAQQHYENFKDRFADWPFRIEVMSRFSSAKEHKQIQEALAEGKVDIVVGTHKLLQDDVKFKDLGLVIIDEEHRFGVRQKDKFKALRADVDILTLTATPIPRTLNMALSGMRDLSIIATAPAKRLAIKTFVREREKMLIREAIMREILRGGQVYFLHNEVETIDKTAAEIAEIVPEARVAIGHGQMRERDLERVMSDFYHQRFNVLVCTTIIETGIDVPSANTIIMDRADHLGLAQLHQLRGRVGRSHHQAYAYLLTPNPKRMTKDAKKRLEAIESLEDLGAGFALATHDLEIRGAGELLGEDQSGQIASVGFTLYMEMLERAVEALKQGKEPSLDEALSSHTEIELRIPALLPDDYIGDVNTRLSLYKKVANCKNDEELDDLQVELIDRFGLLPEPAKNLLKLAQMKLIARGIGIRKIEASQQGGFVEFEQDTRIDPGFIIKLIQSQPRIYRLEGPQKLKFSIATQQAQERVNLIADMLDSFKQKTQAA